MYLAYCYHFDTISVMAMTLRLDPDTDLRLTELAKALGISKSQAVVTAVERLIASQSSETVTSRIFDKVLERDAELLQRLSDA